MNKLSIFSVKTKSGKYGFRGILGLDRYECLC